MAVVEEQAIEVVGGLDVVEVLVEMAVVAMLGIQERRTKIKKKKINK